MESVPCGGEITSTPKRVILGDLNRPGQGGYGSSPISPMANLKLLIKVATGSPQQQQQISSTGDTSTASSGDFLVVTTPEFKKQPRPSRVKYTRQLRSLGFICKKFLQFYSLDVPRGESKEISLGNLAMLLEIEKRRVYDIINVVSSLDMAIKVCKDRYVWYGSQYLPSVLLKLRDYALKNKLDTLVESIFQHPLNFFSDNSQNLSSPNKEGTQISLSSNLLRGGGFDLNVNNNNYSLGSNQTTEHSMVEDNRIAILCQKFVTLFLVAPRKAALNLSLVSKLILPRDVQDKTGMRRLYDIANVLESLGLIYRQKGVKMSRKPSFVYCGPDLSTLNSVQCSGPAASIRSLWRPMELEPEVFPLDANDDSNSVTESDSQGSGNECRLSDMLQVVCTELERLNEGTSTDGRSPSAKKQLFPPIVTPVIERTNLAITSELPTVKSDSESSFIKAPDQSFRLLCNRITAQPGCIAQPSPNSASISTTSSRYPCVSISGYRRLENGTPTIRLNKIARPIKVIKQLKLTTSEIQNGAIYKAVKNGNVIHLVQL